MAWFLVGSATVSVLLLGVPTVLLVVLVDPGRLASLVSFAGILLAGQSTAVGPLLLAAAPSRQSVRGRRLRTGVPLAVTVLGVVLLAGGLWAPLGPGTALVVALGYGVLLLVVTRGLHTWAGRVALRSPMDVPTTDDDARLAPAALRRRLVRTGVVATVLGTLAAAVAGVGAALSGGGPREVLGLAGAALVGIAALAVLAGTFPLLLRAARRANSVAHNHTRLGWRVAWRIQTGRAGTLSSDDHATAVRWAHAAQPLLIVQTLFLPAAIAPGFVVQLYPLVLEPQVGFRLWALLGIGGSLLAVVAVSVHQHVATRRFARAHPLPEPTEALGT